MTDARIIIKLVVCSIEATVKIDIQPTAHRLHVHPTTAQMTINVIVGTRLTAEQYHVYQGMVRVHLTMVHVYQIMALALTALQTIPLEQATPTVREHTPVEQGLRVQVGSIRQ